MPPPVGKHPVQIGIGAGIPYRDRPYHWGTFSLISLDMGDTEDFGIMSPLS